MAEYEILKVHAIKAPHNNVVAFATVAIRSGDLEVVTAGWCVTCRYGELRCKPAAYCSEAREWLPTVSLPQELDRAIRRDIIQQYTAENWGA
jgi:hypothetical protein